MNKLILIIVSLALSATAAYAKDCTNAIAKANAYQGVVAEVSVVSIKAVSDKEAILYSTGVRYDFTYAYPNGYRGQTFTVLPVGSEFQVMSGYKMIWIPASEGVRKLYPNEDRHNPAIVDKNCKIFGIDFSKPAKQIVGL